MMRAWALNSVEKNMRSSKTTHDLSTCMILRRYSQDRTAEIYHGCGPAVPLHGKDHLASFWSNLTACLEEYHVLLPATDDLSDSFCATLSNGNRAMARKWMRRAC